MKKIGSAFFARLRACALAGAAALIVMNPSQSFAQTETESSDLEIIYVYEVEEAIESEGFKPLITRTAGPWGKSKILDTPYSLNVMSSDLIKNAGVSSFDEIAKMSPVVQLKYPNASPRGTAFFNIRGFNLGQANGRLQDGIRRIYYGIPMEDKERVEILSGLSGFLYGPAHAGGAVNFVTKRPTPKTFATLLVGFRDGFTPYGHLDFGGPIDSEGRYGYRINAAVRNGETAIRNQEQLSAVVSGAFDFHITENAVWRFAASHYVNKNDNAPSEWRVLPGATRPSAPDPKSELAIGSRDKRVQDDFSTEINWDINDIFTVRTGFLYSNMNILYRDYKVNTFYANGTFLSGYNVDFNHPETPVTQMGGYFYIDSSFSTGILDHNLTLGVNTDYLHLMMIEPPTVYISLPPTLTTTVILNQKTKNFNYIIGDEISIFDKWKILIGGSYSNYEVSDLINNRTNEKHRITPTFSLAYKPSEQWTLYATYIESLESGAFVGGGYTNAGQFLDPYVSEQYEIGAKAEIGGMFLTLALFDIEKANPYDVINPNGTRTRTSDGLQQHQGVELTATGKIADNWRLFGGLTFLKARLKKDTDAARIGKRPVDVSERMIKLYTEYDTPFLPGLTVNGGLYHFGPMFGDNLNTDRIPGATTFDLGLSYRTELWERPFRLNFLVQNVADKKYWISSYYLGNPRTFMLTGQINFL